MHNCDRTCRATVRQLRSAVRIGLLGVPHRQPEERGLRTTEIAELMTRAARRRDGQPAVHHPSDPAEIAGTPPNSRRTPAGNAPRDCLSAAMRLAGWAEFLSRRSGTGFGPSFRRCRGVSIWPSAARLGVFQRPKGKAGSSPWVFPSHTGGPVSLYSVPHMFHGVLKRAAVESEVPRPTPRIRHSDISVWD